MNVFKIILGVLLLNGFTSFAQNEVYDHSTQKLTPSPEASSISKFVDFPIGYNTGTPNVTIPITNIVGRGLNIPINLSYHAGGVRVDDISSTVGLGWSLNTGGFISRTVIGKADELSDGYIERGNLIPYPLDATNPNHQDYLRNFSSGIWDSKPDIFSFSAGDYSGKFVIESAGTIRLIPHQDVKISYNLCTSCEVDGIKSFTVTTPDGLIYTFGNNALDYATTSSFPLVSGESCVNKDFSTPVATGWHLVNVINPETNDSVTYSYQENEYRYDVNYDETYKLPQIGYSSSSCTVVSKRKCITQKTEHTAILSGIVSSEGSIVVDLDYSRNDITRTSGNTRIKGIRINNVDGTLRKRFQFNQYNQYASGSTPSALNSSRYRMYLDGVSEYDQGGSIIKTTSFTYANRNLLPPRLSFKQDHWGYFNGENNSQLTPFTNNTTDLNHVKSYFSEFVPANRNPNPSKSFYGTLKQVKYPTGGTVDYQYEGNEIPICANVTTKEDVSSVAYQTYSGSESTKITNFNLDFDQTVSISYDVLMIGFRQNGSSVQVVNNATGEVLFQKGGAQEMDSPNTFVGNTTLFMNAGSYRLVSVVKQGPDPNLFPPYSTNPEHADIGVIYQHNVTNYVQNKPVGGIRVKKTIIDDGDSDISNRIIKEIDYSADNSCASTSGIYLGYEPNYQKFDLHTVPDGVSPCQYKICSNIVLTSKSVASMTNTAGSVVEYSLVTVKHGTNAVNGYTKYEYDVFPDLDYELSSYNDSYMYYNSPKIDRSYLNGKLKHKTVYNNVGLKIEEDIYNYEFNESVNYHGVRTMAASELYTTPCTYNSPTDAFTTFHVEWGNVESRWVYLKSEEHRSYSLDGSGNNIVSNTNFTYDIPLGRHTMVKSSSTSNSDGKLYSTLYKYSHEFNTSVCNSLVSKNNILTPIETLNKVQGIIVGGKKNQFSFFSSTGFPTYYQSSISRPPLIYKTYNREVTWNANGSRQDSGWSLDNTINEYHPTYWKPKKITNTGWSPLYLTWVNGLLSQKRMANHTQSYSYFNNRYLKSITDIDGQIQSFEYDNASRLKKITKKGGKEVIDYTYHYKNGSTDKNYVKTKTTYGSASYSSYVLDEKIQYLDGLGRPIQLVDVKQTSDNKDIVVTQSYDNMGRVNKEYIKVKSLYSDGRYYEIPNSTNHTLYEYQKCPNNIIKKETPPDWYPTVFNTTTNSSNEVKKMGTSGYYPANSLKKEIVSDPNGNKTIVYSDIMGRQIAQRLTTSSESVSNSSWTYYVYDDKGRIKSIVPPGAALSSANLIYTYLYNGKDQIIEKKVPDADKVIMKYNNRDLLVLSQDGNMRQDNSSKWMLSKYDIYGRLTEQGFYYNSNPNPNANMSISQLLINNSYDGKNCDGSTFSTLSIYKGKLRENRSRILDGSNTFLSQRMEYDAYGRINKTTGNNHLYNNPSAETYTYKYNYAGDMTYSYRTHKPSSSQTTRVRVSNYIDSDGRNYLQSMWSSLPGGASTTLYRNQYDYRDRVVTKKLGYSNGTYLQYIDYTYNDQDWVTRINNPSLGGGAIPLPSSTNTFPNPTTGSSVVSNDLFYEEIRYDQLYPGLSGVSQKNGNISQQIFRVRGRERIAFKYTYDYLNRLKRSYDYQISEGGTSTLKNKYYTSNYYDIRGNLTRLYRKGPVISGSNYAYNYIDNLTYTYHSGSNKIKRITDSSISTHVHKGHKPGSATDYLYDHNGNMIYDPSRGMSITYNHLNLPVSMVINSNHKIDYIYDASGNKLREIVTDVGSESYSTTKDYVDGIEYKDSKLEAIAHDNGRWYNVNVNTSISTVSLRHEYSLKDHLGNTRLTFTDKDLDGKIEVSTNPSTNEILSEHHYYSFGLPMMGPWMNGSVDQNTTRYTYNGKEAIEGLDLNLLDYGARFYDPSIGRFTSVDPLADDPDNVAWSPYTYVFNNPLRYVDPDGRMAVDALGGDPPGWVQSIKQSFEDLGNSIKEYFNFGSLVMGTEGEKVQTLSRVNEAANVADEITNNALDVVESSAKNIGTAADVVEGAALTTTALSGGSTAPASVPVAGVAEIVSSVALVVEVGVDYARDGKLNKTTGSIVSKVAFGVSGKTIDKGVDAMKIGGTHANETTNAVKSIGQGVNKVTEQAIKKKNN